MKKFVYLLAVVSILIFPVYAEEQISSVAESYSDFYASQYQVSVYDSEEEYANDSPITEWRMPGGQGYHVMLKDGNVLEITASNVDMHLFKSNTIF